MLNYTYCALLLAACVLLLVRRAIRSPEGHIAVLLLAILLVTLAGGLYAGFQYHVSPDLLISVLLIELGLFARIYDAHRTFTSISGTLRNAGSVYIFTGIVCIFSRIADFPVLLWLVPLLLFSLGYFFLRRRKGLGNLCKGLGVLVSVGFIAAMLYDVHEGAAPSRRRGILKGRFLPEIIKPSIVEELNALNEKVIALQGDRDRLKGDLALVQTERAALDAQLKQATLRLGELEKSGAVAAAAVKKLGAENKTLKEKLDKATAAGAEAERKLAELESARAAVKEGFSAIEEKLDLAAENLKKAVAERDSIKAELDALKGATAGTPLPTSAPGGIKAELDALKNQLREKEAERAALAAELERLKETLERARKDLEPKPTAVGTQEATIQ
jgi:regulator of replication initiation timing